MCRINNSGNFACDILLIKSSSSYSLFNFESNFIPWLSFWSQTLNLLLFLNILIIKLGVCTEKVRFCLSNSEFQILFWKRTTCKKGVLVDFPFKIEFKELEHVKIPKDKKISDKKRVRRPYVNHNSDSLSIWFFLDAYP